MRPTLNNALWNNALWIVIGDAQRGHCLRRGIRLAQFLALATFLAGCGGGGGGAPAPPVVPPGGGGDGGGGGAGTVTGRVVDAANPAIAISNFAARTDTNESVTVVGSPSSTAGNNFTITSVTAGTRTVTINAPAFNSVTTMARTVSANQTTDFGTIALSASGAGAPPPPPPPGF